MLAIAAAVLAILAGLGVTLGEIGTIDLLCFAIALIALHLAFPLPIKRR